MDQSGNRGLLSPAKEDIADGGVCEAVSSDAATSDGPGRLVGAVGDIVHLSHTAAPRSAASVAQTT